MMGCYDFCGHYEWTFDWLERTGGKTLVRLYWIQAINQDSQRHARDLIRSEGFTGMRKYWGHTLAEESPERAYTISEQPGVFRIDMHACPSKGFLLRNDLANYQDYCDHCMGWIGPMMREAGFVIDHEHNHQGQCWWEIRSESAPPEEHSTPGALAGRNDARSSSDWLAGPARLDRYHRATDPDDKMK